MRQPCLTARCFSCAEELFFLLPEYLTAKRVVTSRERASSSSASPSVGPEVSGDTPGSAWNHRGGFSNEQ